MRGVIEIVQHAAWVHPDDLGEGRLSGCTVAQVELDQAEVQVEVHRKLGTRRKDRPDSSCGTAARRRAAASRAERRDRGAGPSGPRHDRRGRHAPGGCRGPSRDARSARLVEAGDRSANPAMSSPLIALRNSASSVPPLWGPKTTTLVLPDG